MHHRKDGFSHGMKKKGHGKKYRGHGGHSEYHEGLFKAKGHKKMHGHHAHHLERGELDRGHQKVLDFYRREHSRPIATGEKRSQGRSDAKADVKLGKCVLCGKCTRVCPTEAIMVNEESIRIDVDKCNGCGQCVERCKKGAMFLVEGKEAVTN